MQKTGMGRLSKRQARFLRKHISLELYSGAAPPTPRAASGYEDMREVNAAEEHAAAGRVALAEGQLQEAEQSYKTAIEMLLSLKDRQSTDVVGAELYSTAV
eukprot:SAG11_NODE_856_length_6864_cov_12.741168_3_plen_101_part_00